MTQKDVIICSYNCGGPMNCREEAEKFLNPPIIIQIHGGAGSSGFKRKAKQFLSNNSILDNLLTEKLPSGITPGRVCIASFSAGWAFSTEIVNCDKDRNRIDTTLVMDGIHTPNLNGWKSFASLCAIPGGNSPKLWLAHTQIIPPYISTTTTNSEIINHARISQSEATTTPLPIPSYIVNAKIDKPIKIYSSIVKPNYKVFEEDTLEIFEAVGNISRFEYKGKLPQDHIYNAHYVQPRFWKWLRELWRDPKQGVFFEGKR